MKPCPSYPGYSATEDGKIISHRRRGVRIGGAHGGTISNIDLSHQYQIKEFTTEKGYKSISVRGSDGKTHHALVHQLVADAFHGPREDGKEVRHFDGNPANNKPENLIYGTSLENAADRHRHGRYANGHKHCNAKLTDAQASEIKALRKDRIKVKEIASMYGVSVSTIEGIIYGRTYRI